MVTKEKIKSAVSIKIPLWFIIVVFLAVCMLLFILSLTLNKETNTEVITKSSLEKIVDLSELSTFESVYNGVAEVLNKENPEKIDYYVAYESRVKAGIDFEKIEIDVIPEEKKVIVTIPEIQINGITVDMESLEYIFINNRANTVSVSAEAYDACIADAEKEVENQAAIIELAEENARNIVEALIHPFINQLDEEYVLEIQ